MNIFLNLPINGGLAGDRIYSIPGRFRLDTGTSLVGYYGSTIGLAVAVLASVIIAPLRGLIVLSLHAAA